MKVLQIDSSILGDASISRQLTQSVVEQLQQKYAEAIGLAFQIVDDILDVTSDTATLGKPVGSDDKNEKITYVKLMGIEKSQETVDELTKEAVNALGVFDGDTSFLEKLAYKLALRKK